MQGQNITEMTDTNNNESALTVGTTDKSMATVKAEKIYTEAPSLLTDTDFDSLVADAQDIESLRQQGLIEEDYEFYGGAGSGSGDYDKYDKSYLHHRQCKFKDDTAITWSRAVPKEVKDAGITAYPTEITPKYRVVGVRGIPFKFEFGFGIGGMLETLVKGKEGIKPQKIFPCKTKAVLNLDNDTKVTSDRPLNRPATQLHKDKNNVSTLNPYFPWQHKSLIANKFDFESQEWMPKPKSCQECISEGAWFITSYKDETDTTQYKWGGDLANVIQGGKCSLTGDLLFFVTQIGIDVIDSPHYEDDPVTYPREVKWVLPEDLKMKDRDKGAQTGPFILRLEGLGKSLVSKFGDGTWDLSVKLPSMYKETEEKTYYIPDDNVMSAYELNQFLYDKDATERRIVTQGSGKTLFPVYAEMYFAPLKEAQASKSVTPAFRIIDVGIEKIVEGITMKEYLKAAIAVYSKEVAEAEGEETDISVPSFPVLTPGILPSYNSGSPSLNKRAFTPAVKTLQPDTESLASKAFKTNLSKTPKEAVPKAYTKPTKEDMLIEEEEEE